MAGTNRLVPELKRIAQMALPGRFQKAGQHIVILSRFGWNIKTEEKTYQFIEDDEEVLSKISSHWPTLTQREERV